MPVQRKCDRCGYISSAELCKACIMLDGLNRGRPELSIGKNTKRKKILKMTSEMASNGDSNNHSLDSERTKAENVSEMF